MQRRPWPIKILFLCHLFAPLFNIFNSARMSGVGWLPYVQYKLNYSPTWELIALTALLPLAGLVILACKRWSYFAYIGIMTLVFAYNLYKWQLNPQLFQLPALIGFFMINFFVVGYFLIPGVRSVYFNPRLRWWEAAPRYVVETPAEIITHLGRHCYCHIRNISRGGAAIEFVDRGLDAGQDVTMEFLIEDKQFSLKATLVHTAEGFAGMQFHPCEETANLNDHIRKVIAKKYPERTDTPPLWESFKEWAQLLMTGRGLVPEMPKARTKTAS